MEDPNSHSQGSLGNAFKSDLQTKLFGVCLLKTLIPMVARILKICDFINFILKHGGRGEYQGVGIIEMNGNLPASFTFPSTTDHLRYKDHQATWLNWRRSTFGSVDEDKTYLGRDSSQHGTTNIRNLIQIYHDISLCGIDPVVVHTISYHIIPVIPNLGLLLAFLW